MNLSSQRVDITFIRCARAHAAYQNRKDIQVDDLYEAMFLVFQHRLSESHETLDPSILQEAFSEIFKEKSNHS